MTTQDWVEEPPMCSFCHDKPAILYRGLYGVHQFVCADCKARMDEMGAAEWERQAALEAAREE